ncbi:exopolysaccharide transport family protein [Methylobacterium organophilum]|uniref:GumC family protein n=1 Tax=Methylobacterium organophilum TaxID=410 RepID=UPI001F129BFD|nr:exopolysaccharide transport family protein [Methylobacterium organophilum]UMY18609.1 exopolysaccharide transport family protein [Methylobacterium organophilum]
MNQLSRFDPHIRETSVRDHYDGVAQSAMKLIWRHRRLILIALAVGLVAGLAGVILIRKTYTADALIQLTFSRDEQSRSGSSSQASGTAVEASSLVESEARLLRSRAVAHRVVKRLKLAEDPDFAPTLPLSVRIESWLPEALRPAHAPRTAEVEDSIREDLIALALLQHLVVTNDTRSYVIAVSYSSSDAVRSARIVNAFIDEYINNNMETGVRAAQRTSDWIALQIRQTRTALDAAEAAVNTYRRQSGFLELAADGGTPQQQQLQDLTTRLDAATTTRLAEQAKAARAREIFAAGGVPSTQDLAGAPVIQSLLESRENLRRELAELTLNGPKHPGLARTRSALEETEGRLRTEVEGAIDHLDSSAKAAADSETALAAHIQQIKDAVIDSKKRESQLKSLQLDATSLRDRLKVLTESYAQAVAAAGLASTSAQVAMRAEAIPLPSGPNPIVILSAALFAAAAAGIGAAYLLENRRKGFRSESDLSAETQTLCLGMIPSPSKDLKPREARIFDEAIRYVAASIEVQIAAASSRVILVTSSIPDEGKSAFSLALAEATAKQGGQTLIIDVASGPGEGEAAAPLSLDDALRSDPASVLRGFAADPIVHLHASPRFALDDEETCQRLAALIREAKPAYDLIVIKAPPVLLALDFLPLARLADAVVHLARWGTTPRDTVTAALRRFDSLAVRVCGLVMTHVDLKAHKDYVKADQCWHYWAYRRYYAQHALPHRLLQS